MVLVDVLYLFSRIDLCSNIVKDLEKEKTGVEAALKESQRILSIIHEPFPVIQGFEIAAKASDERDLSTDPVTFIEDPFGCRVS